MSSMGEGRLYNIELFVEVQEIIIVIKTKMCHQIYLGSR